jgi:hypothetical protein
MRVYGFIQHMIVNYPLYKKMKGPIVIVYGIKLECEGLSHMRDTEKNLN